MDEITAVVAGLKRRTSKKNMPVFREEREEEEKERKKWYQYTVIIVSEVQHLPQLATSSLNTQRPPLSTKQSKRPTAFLSSSMQCCCHLIKSNIEAIITA